MGEKILNFVMKTMLGIWPIPAAGEDLSVYRWRRTVTFVIFGAYLLIAGGALLSIGYVSVRGFAGFADAATVNSHFNVESAERKAIQDKLDGLLKAVDGVAMAQRVSDRNNQALSDRNSLVGMRERQCELLRMKNKVAADLIQVQINMLQADYHELVGFDFLLREC